MTDLPLEGLVNGAAGGLVALGAAVGAFLGQNVQLRRLRGVVDLALRQQLGPLERRVDALERKVGWVKRT